MAEWSVYVPTQKARKTACHCETATETVIGRVLRRHSAPHGNWPDNSRPDQDTDTATPGLNNESWSSSVAIVAPRGISKAITTLITLPGPMLPSNDALFGLA